jgi:hypothetical protein
MGWERIARLATDCVACTHQVLLPPSRTFTGVKLRSPKIDVQICRWTLEFDNGSTEDFSVGCLLGGTESTPVMVDQVLKRVIVDCQAQAGACGNVEIWAHAC